MTEAEQDKMWAVMLDDDRDYPRMGACSTTLDRRVERGRGLEVYAFLDRESEPVAETGMVDLILYAASSLLTWTRPTRDSRINEDRDREELEEQLVDVERAIAFVRSLYR